MSGHTQWTGREKIGYKTASDAEQHRTDLEAKDGREVHVYKCYTCNLFHVGHPTKKVKWFERSVVGREEAMVGRLIGILRGTAPKDVEDVTLN